MSDMYDMHYGLYNHVSNTAHPLSTVLFLDKENVMSGSVLERSIERYLESGLKEIYGMSLNEYMEIPMDYMEVLIKLSDKEKKRRAESLKEIEEKMKEGK